MPLKSFRQSLKSDDVVAELKKGLIGEGFHIKGENGDVPLIYADYVASGRALQQVEDFVMRHVLPYYANTHTNDSFCGHYTGQLRENARAEIARLTGAENDCSVIFTGSGATAGINRLVHLLGVDKAANAVVLHGPYEHHSNILPWRESGATVIEIPEGAAGGPDLKALELTLQEQAHADLIIGSFSAASNVTGIVTDTATTTRLLKKYNALSVWDYAGGAPYLSIDMGTGTNAQKDVVVLSPHKFPGGPGASGVTIIRDTAVKTAVPTWPGGGTVSYVSPWDHDYLPDVISKEEAGTPNIIGDIRAALVFIVKDVIGQDWITKREEDLIEMAQNGWRDNPTLIVLAADHPHRLPIFSMLVQDENGGIFPHSQIASILSDRYGIQARGGCACAGPYGHRLLNVDQETSEELRIRVLGGEEAAKPGWVRLNFSYLMSDETVQYIIESVNDMTAYLSENKPKRTAA